MLGPALLYFQSGKNRGEALQLGKGGTRKKTAMGRSLLDTLSYYLWNDEIRKPFNMYERYFALEESRRRSKIQKLP